MKRSIIRGLAVGFASLWFGVVGVGAQTTFELVVSESVKATSLDKAALKDLLLGKTPYWDGGQPVEIVILSDKTEPALKEITGMSGSQFKTHWQRLTFSGRGKMPKEAASVDKALAIVAGSKGAITLLPVGTPTTGGKKIDLQ